MKRPPRPRKGDLLMQHLERKFALALGHRRFEMALHRSRFRWLVILWLHPDDKISRRKRARLRNELFSTLNDVDVKKNIYPAVNVYIRIQYEPPLTPTTDSRYKGKTYNVFMYFYEVGILLRELSVLVDIIREQIDPFRKGILCRYALLQCFETAKHMLRILNSSQRQLRELLKGSNSPQVQRTLEDFPRTAHSTLKKLDKSLKTYRDKYVAHRLFERDDKTPLLLVEGVVLTADAVLSWYNELETASVEVFKFMNSYPILLELVISLSPVHFTTSFGSKPLTPP